MFQQHVAVDEICLKSIELYFAQKRMEIPEAVYFHKYNQMLLEIGGVNASHNNTFRFLYTSKSKLLAIHYYEDLYFGLDLLGYKFLKQHVSNYVHEDSVIQEATNEKSKRFLSRNLKLVKKVGKKPAVIVNGLSTKVIPYYSVTKLMYGAEEEDFAMTRKRQMPEDEKLLKRIRKPLKRRKEGKPVHSGVTTRRRHRS